MVSAAIVAAALQGTGARTWSIYVNGLDVVRNRTTTGNTYGVDPATVTLTQAAPGAVSGLTFTLLDPASETSIVGGEYVVLYDHIRDQADFAGWITTPTITPLGTGRAFQVDCIGIEILLDWTRFTSAVTVSIPALAISDTPDKFIVQLCSYAPWGFPVGVWQASGSDTSSATTPLSTFHGRNSDLGVFPLVIPAGTTVRDGIAAILAVCNNAATGWKNYVDRITIDYQGRLRGWTQRVGTATDIPTDWTGITAAASYAGPAPASQEHVLDVGATVRGVIVTGVGASAFVTDGSGIPGPIQSITVTSTTAADCTIQGQNYLAANAAGVRGRMTLESWTPSVGERAGAWLALTADPVASTGTWMIGEIRRTFTPDGRVDMNITYGGLPPSYIDTKG